MIATRYRTVDVDSLKVFYREAGSPDAPALILLHGYPSAGHQFRDLIPRLADDFHLVAPDIPGFGQTEMPSREKFITRSRTWLTSSIGSRRSSVWIASQPTSSTTARRSVSGSPLSTRTGSPP